MLNQISERKNQNQQESKTQIIQLTKQKNCDDYEIIARNSQTSLKYKFTLMNKPIHTLDQNQPQDSIRNKAIVCSYADMQFKLSPTVHKQWLRLMSDPKLILGYMFVEPQVNNLLISRIKKNIYSEIQQQWLMSASSMLGIYFSVVKYLSNENDSVLIFTPTYYRFMFTLKDQKRNVIEYQLKTKLTEKGKQFYIDFQQLEEIFVKNNIKLIVWANPHNPSGRVWRKGQLQQLSNLVQKYKTYIFSDDIFCQCLIDPSKYTSLLTFKQTHPYLIWASSFGKAFNCSGNSYSYSFVPNCQTRKILNHAFDHIPLFVDYSQFKLLESCYTVGQQWRVNTLKYIRQNYQILIQQSNKRQLKLQFYTLDSSYLFVVDFKNYGWKYQEIKNKIEAQNIFPTYFDACYVNKQAQDIQIVRINLAINRKLVYELIDRLQRSVKFIRSIQ